jgi:hypothetical protein
MSSFDRLLEIYPAAYTDEERAQTFLWYHLRRYPREKTAHINKFQEYFRKADRKVPSADFIRRALNDPKRFPPGSKPDTFGFDFRGGWHDDNFGSCFDSQSFAERAKKLSDSLRAEHPWGYWLGVAGSIASIIGIPLSLVLWWMS